MQLRESITIIKNHYPSKETGEKGKILNEMLALIKEKSNGFKDVEAISKEPLNMKSILQREGIKPVEWRKHKGSFERSESDTVIWLAQYLSGTLPRPQQHEQAKGASGEEDRARKIKVLKLRAKAVQIKLKLLNFK